MRLRGFIRATTTREKKKRRRRVERWNHLETTQRPCGRDTPTSSRMLGFESRSLQQHDSSEDIVDDDDQWTELDPGDWKDWVHIALTGLYQLVVFLAVMHLWRQRSWPPYCPRQISLV